MTMAKWKLCVQWAACRGSPSSISLACFKQEEQTKLVFISFSNGTGSAFENSLDSGYPFASIPARCTTLLERGTCSGDGPSLWDYCTARLSASDLSMPLTSEVGRSPERLQGHRRQMIARSGKFVRRAYSRRVLDCLPSCAMYKNNAVGNVVAEMGRDLVFMTTGRLSDLSMPLKGEVRRSYTVCMAADSEKRQICTTCFFAEGFGLWTDDGLMLSPIVEHTSVWEGVRGRREIWRGRPQWNAKDQLPKPQTATLAKAQWPK